MTDPPPDNELELAALMAEHGTAVARAAALYERDPTERKDLIQEIWLAVWRALPAFRGESSVRTYLFRIAHNCGISHGARRSRADRPAELPLEVDPSPTPEQSAGRREDAERLASALRTLPLVDRQIVGLKLEGLANREIAETVGLSENNVAVRLTRARGRLKQLLEATR